MPDSAEHALYLAGIRRRARLVRLAQALILIAFFTVWEAAAAFKWIDPFIFSRPSRVWKAAAQLAVGGDLFKHVGVTLWETALGFALSTIIGVGAAVALWWNGFLERTLAPYIVVLNSLPKTALAPMIIVIAGNNGKAVVATAVMTAVIVTLMNTLAGFLAVNKEKIKLIQTLGGNKRDVLTKLVLPAGVPMLLNTVKINVGLSFVGVIVGEFLVAKAGLGYLIVYGSQIFKMDWVVLGVLTLAFLAAGLYQLVVLLERRFLRHYDA